MFGFISQDTSCTPRQFILAGGVFAGFVVAAALAGTARAEPPRAIPNLASAEFGWQSNVADWQEPPPGRGHGPIKPDPDHPFTSNAEAARTGTQPTRRIGDSRDPVLKPWAAAQMKASNEEALRNEMRIPFAAQARCYPGGVPGQLLFPFEPLYFIQAPKVVYMIWQRDHMVRRVSMTDRHSEKPKPSWFGESIGRYENGDTLVIDTIGLNTKTFVDNYRTPHTDQLHVVERFRMIDGGKTLEVRVRVEDPGTFTTPWNAVQRFARFEGARNNDGRLVESICAESASLGQFDFGNYGATHSAELAPVPQSAKPDF